MLPRFTPPVQVRRVFYTGLDLGQSQDPSALVTVEQTTWPDKSERDYAVRHLHRWKLGTSYPQIVSDLDAIFGTAQLVNTTLIIDATGVGRPVVDMVRQAKLRAKVKAFSITCGMTPGDETVPKKDLVGAVQALLQSRRLKIADKLELGQTLAKELEMFRVKVTSDRNETFASWRARDHADLVLGLGLAVWYAESKRGGGPDPYAYDPRPATHDLPAGTFDERGLSPDVWR
jgi:hypothetical protein